MKLNVVIYRGNEITRFLKLNSRHVIKPSLQESESYLLVRNIVDPDLYYIEDRELRPRNKMTLRYKAEIAVGDLLAITGIPVGAQVVWPDKVSTTEQDGKVSCIAPYAGDYTFRVWHPKYFPEEVTINVPT